MIRCNLGLRKLDWVIVGGESNGRPCDIEWIESIVTQCQEAGTAVFVKQLGSSPFSTADEFCRFQSFQQWVNKARSWLGGISGGGVRYKRAEKTVCVDAAGRICRNGGDMARARDEGQFPVRACLPIVLKDRKGGDPSEWRESLRVREFPKVVAA